jgi:hypothetical protein
VYSPQIKVILEKNPIIFVKIPLDKYVIAIFQTIVFEFVQNLSAKKTKTASSTSPFILALCVAKRLQGEFHNYSEAILKRRILLLNKLKFLLHFGMNSQTKSKSLKRTSFKEIRVCFFNMHNTFKIFMNEKHRNFINLACC